MTGKKQLVGMERNGEGNADPGPSVMGVVQEV